MASSASPEKGSLQMKGPEAADSRVVQPEKQVTIESIDGLSQFLEAVNRISEKTGEDTSARDNGGGGNGPVGKRQAQPAISARDLAIAALPAPELMQKQLERHIRQEVKRLHTQARQVARLGSTPGAAYRLTRIIARIRQYNALLAELLEAGVDLLRRFFIRVFVDKQPIL